MTPGAASPLPGRRGGRAGRIARALTVGYAYQAVVAVTGLVLTPFLLRELGVADYGQWLVVGQVLGLLGLLDIGVMGVLPREVARAAGAAGGEPVAAVVGRAWWLVGLQTPLVGLAAVGVWFGVSSARPELTGPLALILGAFVLQFPFRMPAVVLNGLQDLTFCAAAQAVGWAVTTAASVALVFAGWGLYSLAAGWAAGQFLVSAVCLGRLRRKFPAALPAGDWPGRAALAEFLRPSFWTSLRQVAQLLLTGTELIILGWVVGPAAVVVYACTTKVLALVVNQPYLISTAALPAVTEIQALGERDRLWRACRALGLAILLASGGLAVAVVAVNGAFVPWWVGPYQYGGPTLTLLAVVAMIARHWTFTLLQTVFALGHDRRLAVTALADGLVTVAATVGWVAAVGVIGLPLGSLTGLVLTNGPVAVFTLAAEEGVSPLRVLRSAAPWLVRFLAVGAPVAAASFSPHAADPVFAAGLLAGGVVAYAVLCLSLLGREPLRSYREQAVATLRRKLGFRTPA